jgi:hypothetical protein
LTESWAAANPSESELREQLERERVGAAAELESERARAADRVKRLPIVCDAYLKAKTLLQP